MEVKIQRAQLLSHLQRAQNIVERKTTLPILAHILMETEPSGLRLSSTDLEVGVTEACDAQIVKEGSTTIHARKFFEIIREIPEGEIHVKRKDEQLEIRAGRSRFRLRSLSPEEFPKIPAIETTESVKLSSDILQEMIQKVFVSVSSDETRYTLTGILTHMVRENDETLLRMVATDGHRLSFCERKLPDTDCLSGFQKTSEGQEQDIILPKKGVQEIRRLMEDGAGDLEFGLFQENAFIRKNNLSMIMRLVQGKFPDYLAVFPAKIESVITAEASVLEESLRRVSVLSTEKSKGIRFSVKPDKLTFFSNSPEIGEAEEEVDVVYKGEPFEVAFNVRYLLDFLQTVKGKVSIEFGAGFKPCVMREKDDLKYSYIVMPLRI
jgi:DNA polymerase-3 subunit beta